MRCWNITRDGLLILPRPDTLGVVCTSDDENNENLFNPPREDDRNSNFVSEIFRVFIRDFAIYRLPYREGYSPPRSLTRKRKSRPMFYGRLLRARRTINYNQRPRQHSNKLPVASLDQIRWQIRTCVRACTHTFVARARYY